ncbi:MAG: MotA/TolQ/ExbB proton channel family protein [Gammaproteobacteria bacterium]
MTGLIVFGIVVSWNEGLIMQLIRGDQSRICLVIGLLYIIATIHCVGRVIFLSSELNHAADVANRIAATGNNKEIRVKDGCLSIGNAGILPACIITNYLVDMVDARAEKLSMNADQEKSHLIEALAERLKGAHELGWFVVDILLKLGLVGTIIGFILMLGSVANTVSLDVNTMQKVLRQMSSGMGTALFTTLAGLIGSILLGLQYLLLDKGADELLHRVIRVTEIEIKPTLKVEEAL